MWGRISSGGFIAAFAMMVVLFVAGAVGLFPCEPGGCPTR